MRMNERVREYERIKELRENKKLLYDLRDYEINLREFNRVSNLCTPIKHKPICFLFLFLLFFTFQPSHFEVWTVSGISISRLRIFSNFVWRASVSENVQIQRFNLDGKKKKEYALIRMRWRVKTWVCKTSEIPKWIPFTQRPTKTCWKSYQK